MPDWNLRQMIGATQTRSLESFEFTPLGEAVKHFRTPHTSPWKQATIAEAMGVPAIQRAVSLIANTTGSLSVEGIRNGEAMDEPPRIVQRPDPFRTPREFYRDTAYYLATRGEAVWWIGARDFDGLPASLIVVPLRELTVEDNPRNRAYPIYRWGKETSFRYSPATPTGDFVHITYLKEPGDLRGKGPLQWCGAAVSVSVEAQEWAANFFGGNTPSLLLKSQVDLDENEAKALKAQWMEESASGVPRVSTPTLDVQEFGTDPDKAQLNATRTHQDGDAARMFGIPGKLLEYAAPGSSLTYQNIAEVFTDFVRSCLSINYLEPIEQAMTDLLTRSTIARFAVDGLLRADIKTRFEVYEKAVTIWGPEEGGDYARIGEGRIPGNIETRPVPFAYPAAVPALPETRAVDESREKFADAMMKIATREQMAPVVNVHPAPITVESPEIHVAAPDMTAVADVMNRPLAPVEVKVTTPPDETLTVALNELRTAIANPRKRTIERDENGRIVGMVEE